MTASIGTGFSTAERPTVESALRDAPGNVAQIVQRLQDRLQDLQRPAAAPGSTSAGAQRGPLTSIRIPSMLQVPRGPDRDWERLRGIFSVDRAASGASGQIQTVMSAYRGAANILDETGTRLDRLTPDVLAAINARIARVDPGSVLNGPYVWGWAAIDAGDASAPCLIYIGDAFFNPQPDDSVRGYVANCQGHLNLDLARVAILVHEAIHWLNGRGGHPLRDPLANPENYSRFLIFTLCDRRFVQAEAPQDRRYARTAEPPSPGAPPLAGRLRKPGPFA